MKLTPLISVITPSFNQGRFIGEAIASVDLQSYNNCEHLVIDGMSTDATARIMRNLMEGRRHPCISWISEPDTGQSEALNKGFKLAKGDIIGWLNSDDRYLPGCFEHVVRVFEENPQVDIVYGDYRLVNELGNAFRTRREIEFSAFVLQYHRVLYIPTTTTFFRRKIFDEGNWINEDLHYAMDFDFFLRLAAHGYQFRHISEILADFRYQINSKTCSFPEKQQMEHQQILFKTAPIFSHINSLHIKKIMLSCLRLLASIKRYSEKARKGYYWEQLRSN
jgi:glycosyltransferase involved in cell wall biosynthesis